MNNKYLTKTIKARLNLTFKELLKIVLVTALIIYRFEILLTVPLLIFCGSLTWENSKS